jgi:hypothetical protein
VFRITLDAEAAEGFFLSGIRHVSAYGGWRQTPNKKNALELLTKLQGKIAYSTGEIIELYR